MLSCTLSGELSTETVTASVLPVETVDAEDRDGDGVVASEGELDEVERVERVFSGVVSDVICWVSEDKLARVEPDKKLKYFCFFSCKVCGDDLETSKDFVPIPAKLGKANADCESINA